jgi:hypothetical protein
MDGDAGPTGRGPRRSAGSHCRLLRTLGGLQGRRTSRLAGAGSQHTRRASRRCSGDRPGPPRRLRRRSDPELRKINPRTQALVLSAHIDREQVARAVESGAAGVLHKTMHPDELVDAMRRLGAWHPLMPLEEVVELLRFANSSRDREYTAGQAIEKLTPPRGGGS